MRKLITIILLLLFYFTLPQQIQAAPVADKSAELLKSLSTDSNNKLREIKKKIVINRVLTKFDSPLTDSNDAFVQTCFNYKLNCYLLPSIAGLESGFGKYIAPNSYNPFGWGGGYIVFANWDEAIEEVGRGLKRNYIDKGASTVEQIAPIYAESKTWAARINHYLSLFQSEEEKINSIFDQNTVNL